MLDRARNSDGDVKFWCDDLPGLTDLHVIGRTRWALPSAPPGRRSTPAWCPMTCRSVKPGRSSHQNFTSPSEFRALFSIWP